ncbi:Calpain-A [Lamellibrachia satsuma]|nr:Calpain-A [Lamellibrachia satsuma]
MLVVTDGYTLVVTDGYTVVVTDGYTLVVTDGYTLVVTDGYTVVVTDGYTLVVTDGYTLVVTDGYTLVVTDGYTLVVTDGYTLVVTDGYTLVVTDGYTLVVTDGYTLVVTDGYTLVVTDGYTLVVTDGYTLVVTDGYTLVVTDGYTLVVTDGYTLVVTDGYTLVVTDGYTLVVTDGYTLVVTDGYTLVVTDGYTRGATGNIVAFAFYFNTKGRKTRLIRLRNPWGKKEWTGDWSDRSKLWQDVSEKDKSTLELKIENDGEFWMSFEDWKKNFKELQICYLTPESSVIDYRRKQWRMEAKHGEWVPGVSAGGCGNPPNEDMYWTNPQYHVTLHDPDEDGDDNTCTLIVSLIQKDQSKAKGAATFKDVNNIIGYDIFKVKDSVPTLLDGDTYSARALLLEHRMDTYSHYREVCHRYSLKPGRYCVIPATFEPNENGGFYLRAVTDTEAELG